MNFFSRSIILILLFAVSIFAKTITLLPHYCIDNQSDLNSNFFGVNEAFKVITVPKLKTSYSVPAFKIKKVFIEKGYEVEDSSSNMITFEKNCNLAGKENEIALKILEKFEEKFPCLEADLPQIKSTSPLPPDFEKYSLVNIKLRDSAFRKRKGSFKALFKTPQKEKSLYFKYIIDADIYAFKAKYKLYNDKILSSNDYEKVKIKIDKLPSNIITCKMPEKLMTKNYISANSLLSMNRFEYKKDVLRGTDIRAYVRDGMLVIATDATVLKDGDIGDVVKIKTDKGKTFNAKLISKYKAIILE